MRFIFNLNSVTTMTKTKRNLFTGLRKMLYNFNDLKVFVPQNPIQQETFNANDLPITNRKSPSFVVDWELPKMEIREVDRS